MQNNAAATGPDAVDVILIALAVVGLAAVAIAPDLVAATLITWWNEIVATVTRTVDWIVTSVTR